MFYLYKNGHTPKDYLAHGKCLHAILDVMKNELQIKAKQTIDEYDFSFDDLTSIHPLHNTQVFEVEKVRNKQRHDNYFVVLFGDKAPIQIMCSFDAAFREIECEVVKEQIEKMGRSIERAKREENIF